MKTKSSYMFASVAQVLLGPILMFGAIFSDDGTFMIAGCISLSMGTLMLILIEISNDLGKAINGAKNRY